MHKRLKTALIALSLLAGAPALAVPAAYAADGAAAAKPKFLLNAMNVYRRFPAEDRDKMVAFYRDVLGLQPLNPINLSATQQVLLFKVGAGQIKLAPGLKEGRHYQPGRGVNEATGIRLYTLTFPDEAALKARFKAAGYPEPAFKDIGGGRRAALVKDPAGFNLELVVQPGASSEQTAGVEVGINVSDLQKSRAFYRDFVGLQELAPVKDPLLGVTKYPFRNGQTTVSLWSAGRNLPKDTGSAGIQYVIGNLDEVNARALAEKVTVEEPLGGVPGFNVRTVWLNDPDGVTDYFYQMGARPQVAAAK